jgi:hypothetical protein
MEDSLHKSGILTALALAALPHCAGAQDVKLANCASLSDQSADDYAIAFACVGLLREETERLQGALATERSRLDALEARLEALETLPAENETLREQLGKVDTLDDNLRRMNKALTDKPFVPATGTHPATRAVVAYTSEKGERTCPPGWSPYEPAKNRFLLGAGDLYQTVGQTGGASEVTLKEAQMPAHRHLMFAGTGSTRGAYPNAQDAVSVVANVGSYGLANENFEYQMRPRTGTPDSGVTGYAGEAEPAPVKTMPPYLALYFCVVGR